MIVFCCFRVCLFCRVFVANYPFTTSNLSKTSGANVTSTYYAITFVVSSQVSLVVELSLLLFVSINTLMMIIITNKKSFVEPFRKLEKNAGYKRLVNSLFLLHHHRTTLGVKMRMRERCCERSGDDEDNDNFV